MKKLIVVLMFMFMFSIVGTASALFNQNNYDYNYNTTSNATGGNVTIEEGAIQNDPTFNNHNKQKQKQDQKQKQKQMQKQAQKQKQYQKQKQDQMNNWIQTFEDKRDHIQGPEVLNSDTKLIQVYPGMLKMNGDDILFSEKSIITYKEAKRLSKGMRHVKVTLTLVTKFDKTKEINIVKEKPEGTFIGLAYAESKGIKSNAAGASGKTLKKAMKAGATHAVPVGKFAKQLAYGKSRNLGIGGGASIMTNNGETAIAPNGGIGIGSAYATSENVPEILFKLYRVE